MYLGGNHRWLLLLRLSVKLHCDDHINNKICISAWSDNSKAHTVYSYYNS